MDFLQHIVKVRYRFCPPIWVYWSVLLLFISNISIKLTIFTIYLHVSLDTFEIILLNRTKPKQEKEIFLKDHAARTIPSPSKKQSKISTNKQTKPTNIKYLKNLVKQVIQAESNRALRSFKNLVISIVDYDSHFHGSAKNIHLKNRILKKTRSITIQKQTNGQ